MLSVRYHPELCTPDLLDRLRPMIGYDRDGHSSRWLVEDLPLPPYLADIARTVCPERDPADFRAVALRGYRDGWACTPCHSDRDATGFCFILSLGPATRTFRVHRVPEGTSPRAECLKDLSLEFRNIQCDPGTAVLMEEAFHDSWHHQVAPDPGVTDERLSLVFRTAVTRPTKR